MIKNKFNQVNSFIQKNILIISLIQILIQVPFSCFILYKTSKYNPPVDNSRGTRIIEPDMRKIKQMIVDETQDRLNDNVLVFRDICEKGVNQHKNITESLRADIRELKKNQIELKLNYEAEIKRLKWRIENN